MYVNWISLIFENQVFISTASLSCAGLGTPIERVPEEPSKIPVDATFVAEQPSTMRHTEPVLAHVPVPSSIAAPPTHLSRSESTCVQVHVVYLNDISL